MNLAAFDPRHLGWALLVAVAATYWIWRRRFQTSRELSIIYFAALAGALTGAKLGYLVVEGRHEWAQPDHWIRWATGKTILGALLGGFVAVEISKKFLGYRQATGDDFAIIAPAGIALGRVGCLVYGCCLGAPCPSAWYALRDASGVSRWPAVPVEMLFNVVFLFVALLLRTRGWMRGQLFHLYLVSYGTFRLMHEPLRATPKLAGGFSGYQVLALLLILAGLAGAWRRAFLSRVAPQPIH